MQKIDFVNSQQPAINDTNLNLMQQYIETAIQGAVSGDTLPVGAILPFGGGTVPDNYFLCDGRAISRTTYSQLFSVIGTSFGVGDGSTTFNIPDLRGKTFFGYDANQTEFNAIGKTSGAKAVTLTKNNLPAGTVVNESGSIHIGTESGTVLSKTTAATAMPILNPYGTGLWIIKAFQTAGVVAEIVNTHSVSATNAYSADYMNGVADYSSTEKVCGHWIDGKPIYRKVITISNRAFSKGTTNIAHNIDNFKMCTNVRCFSELGIIMPYMNLTNDNNSIATFTEISNVDSTSIRIRIANDNWGVANTWYIVLEYTKTTD